MRRWPVALVVLAGLVLAAPAGADAAGAAARSKTVRAPVPKDGEVAFAQYRVTTRSPGKAVIRNSRRLGDVRVIVSGRRVTGRRYEVTAIVINPATGASAAQGGAPGNVQVALQSQGSAPITVTTHGIAPNLLGQVHARRVRRTCTSFRRSERTSYRARRRAGRSRRAQNLQTAAIDFSCQARPTSELLADRQTLESAGVRTPGCFGTVGPTANDAKGAQVELTCAEPTVLVSIRAQAGNIGATCQGPPQSFCACGPACAPLPPESACFNDPNGFELGQALPFRAVWQQEVALNAVRVESLPQGSQSLADREPALTRRR
jgi:hypothetical protein